MKKLLFGFLIIFVNLMVISCKKDPSTDIPIGTFSANIDGTKTTFQVLAKASVLPVQGGFGIKIFGYKKDPSTSGTSFSLLIASPNTITVGTYTENIASNPLVEMVFSYDIFFGLGGSYSNNQSSTNPASITITDISGTSVKGTFQGELEENALNGGIVKTQITSGVFNLSF